MSDLNTAVQAHYALVMGALEALRTAVLSAADVSAKVFVIPPPKQDSSVSLATLGDLDHAVFPSVEPLRDALAAWGTTQRSPGQHPRYVARWVGVVVVPDELETYVEAVNEAKDNLQAVISDVWPVSHYNTAERMARTRAVANSLPLHTDRRLLYRHIPLYPKTTPVASVRLHWRRVMDMRQVSLAEFGNMLENRPIPPDADLAYMADESYRIFNNVHGHLNAGWKLVTRTQKSPEVLANFTDIDHQAISALPVRLPLVVLQRHLAVPAETLLSGITLPSITSEAFASRGRKERSDRKEYKESELPGLFLQK